MAYEGTLLRVGAGSLRSDAIEYVLAETWAAGALRRLPRPDALVTLARSYLLAFGPARVADFKWWAGVTLTEAKAAIGALDTLVIGNDLLLLRADIQEFESLEWQQSDLVTVLPQWDSYTMGYAPDGRDRFVTPDALPLLYGKLGATGGNALGAILVNGEVVATWKHRFQNDSMLIEVYRFEAVTGAVRELAGTRMSQMAELLGAADVGVSWR